MMIKDIHTKTRQQAVMAVMQGKKITFAGLDDNNDDKNEGKKEKRSYCGWLDLDTVAKPPEGYKPDV